MSGGKMKEEAVERVFFAKVRQASVVEFGVEL